MLAAMAEVVDFRLWGNAMAPNAQIFDRDLGSGLFLHPCSYRFLSALAVSFWQRSNSSSLMLWLIPLTL